MLVKSARSRTGKVRDRTNHAKVGFGGRYIQEMLGKECERYYREQNVDECDGYRRGQYIQRSVAGMIVGNRC